MLRDPFCAEVLVTGKILPVIGQSVYLVALQHVILYRDAGDVRESFVANLDVQPVILLEQIALAHGVAVLLVVLVDHDAVRLAHKEILELHLVFLALKILNH